MFKVIVLEYINFVLYSLHLWYIVNWQNVILRHHANVHGGSSDLLAKPLDIFFFNYISDLPDTMVECREFHSLWWRRNWFQMFTECLPEDLMLYWIE